MIMAPKSEFGSFLREGIGAFISIPSLKTAPRPKYFANDRGRGQPISSRSSLHCPPLNLTTRSHFQRRIFTVLSDAPCLVSPSTSVPGSFSANPKSQFNMEASYRVNFNDPFDNTVGNASVQEGVSVGHGIQDSWPAFMWQSRPLPKQAAEFGYLQTSDAWEARANVQASVTEAFGSMSRSNQLHMRLPSRSAIGRGFEI